MGDAGDAGRKWNRPRTLRTNERDFSGVVVPLDETDVVGLLGIVLVPSAGRSDDTRVRLRAGDVRVEDGGVGNGDGDSSCCAKFPYSSGTSALSVSRLALLRLAAMPLLRVLSTLLSVVRLRGTRTLSCFDRRAMPAMLMLEFERVNPARVVLGAWNSSSSWLNAYDRAVRHDCEMTSCSSWSTCARAACDERRMTTVSLSDAIGENIALTEVVDERRLETDIGSCLKLGGVSYPVRFLFTLLPRREAKKGSDNSASDALPPSGIERMVMSPMGDSQSPSSGSGRSSPFPSNL